MRGAIDSTIWEFSTLKNNSMGKKNIEMNMMTLNQLKDRDIGKIGTPERDRYEFDLRMELIGEMIKKSPERK